MACGLGLAEAIEHPRVHPEFGDWGVRVAAEPGVESVPEIYPVRLYDQRHMYFGGVNGAALEAGHLHGHADSRRTGSAVTTP